MAQRNTIIGIALKTFFSADERYHKAAAHAYSKHDVIVRWSGHKYSYC